MRSFAEVSFLMKMNEIWIFNCRIEAFMKTERYLLFPINLLEKVLKEKSDDLHR